MIRTQAENGDPVSNLGGACAPASSVQEGLLGGGASPSIVGLARWGAHDLVHEDIAAGELVARDVALGLGASLYNFGPRCFRPRDRAVR